LTRVASERPFFVLNMVVSRLRGFLRYASDGLCGGHAILLRETQ